jgi:hypothetical protein
MKEEAQFDREILVFVRDADGYLVEDATISWTKDGKPAGRIDHSDGRGAITVKDRKAVFQVTVEYENEKDSRILAVDQPDCTFVFPNLHTRIGWRRTMEKHFPAIIGVAFVLLAVVLAFSFGSPNPLQTHVILAVLSLGGGAFGTEISGIIKADITFGTQIVIGATGAAAIFAILYFVVPAS